MIFLPFINKESNFRSQILGFVEGRFVVALGRLVVTLGLLVVTRGREVGLVAALPPI